MLYNFEKVLIVVVFKFVRQTDRAHRHNMCFVSNLGKKNYYVIKWQLTGLQNKDYEAES